MESVTLTREEMQLLLGCRCPDAVQLYLYRKAGEPLELAMAALDFTGERMRIASEQLRLLGCGEAPAKTKLSPPPKREYTQADLEEAMRAKGGSFNHFVGDVQCRLGRTLSTEELKILLGFLDYLRMPMEVASLLLCYCVDRNRKGSLSLG